MLAPEHRALELVAAALSEEYGVRVVADGFRAYTRRDANNMPVITIPALPLQDKNYRLLVRGYIDHEVGHVRFGCGALLAEAILAEPETSGAFKAIVSIYEDVRVDRLMSECFKGCGRNLRKLALLLYGEADVPDAAALLAAFQAGELPARQMPWRIWQAAVQFILYAARSQALAQLAPLARQWREALALLAPGLVERLEPLLGRLPEEGADCKGVVNLARATVAVIADWLQAAGHEGAWQEAGSLELPWLLRNGGEARDQSDMGNLAASRLDRLINDLGDAAGVTPNSQWHERGGEVWQKRVQMLSEGERKEALACAAKMSAQMQALLQSHVLNREGPFRQGKLHTRNLHKLFIGRDDLFRRQNERREINTEIVCCIDMSGSMQFDDKAPVASRSLYAVVESLAHIQGLKLVVTGFYDNDMVELYRSPAPLDARMKIVPYGGTLCGAAVRSAARLFGNAPRRRKIIIMITDGDANDPDYFHEAITDLGQSGIEILGIGIHDSHILEYLPPEQSCVLSDIHELAALILAMLRKKLGVRA